MDFDYDKEETSKEEEDNVNVQIPVSDPDPEPTNQNAQDSDFKVSDSVDNQSVFHADANDNDVTLKSQDNTDTNDLVLLSSPVNNDTSVVDTNGEDNVHPPNEPVASHEIKAENNDQVNGSTNGLASHLDLSPKTEVKESKSLVAAAAIDIDSKVSNFTFLNEPPVAEGEESGTEEEQAAFVREVENVYKDRNIEFKHPKFYKEDLNLLKLWRAVIRLGGYEEVTSCKLWRQVGESFNPPKTCTTVSWTFRIFYEKALLEYEKQRTHDGEQPVRDASHMEPNRIECQSGGNQALGSGRARRDAAARAMQGWHSKRFLESGEVCQPIIKDKNSGSTPKIDRQIKNLGLLKRKRPSTIERAIQVAHMKGTNPLLDSMVIDIGPPADWVKINVQKTSDCFEVYALVPGFLREEVHVQSDPAGRLVISGQPEQVDNPWGVTPFKKVVSLPSRIDPHQTSAVVTLHGQLFVRVPFEQLEIS